MLDGLVFGWRSALLTFAVLQLLAIAAALPRTIVNRTANRTLAALLVVLAGVLAPWLIGFAGFYDRWRWLTFAPLACPLAIAPLLWFYVHALVQGRWPRDARLHLAPAAAHLLYMAASFLLPLPLKDGWADLTLGPVNRIAWLFSAVGLAAYGVAGLRLLRRYRGLLDAQHSDAHRYAARWLSRAIGATLVLLPVWAIYAAWNAVSPLGYFALMGLHLAIAMFALYLAVEGWRHAGLPFPTMDTLAPATTPEPAGRDWRAQGAVWAETVRREGWAANAELSLAMLARQLGTNTSHLSRALNEGLGMGFSGFINGLRCEAVAAAIDRGSQDDLLDLALEAGFSSKASFNRAFQAAYGMTPSAYRRAARGHTSQIANFTAEARI
ncbi:AraC family transcriptional regulator [Sphingomonas radiodurans]|uniref:AraC family transcriptional regulator n=1 Tax=Sphingomonas radiodurans TaxID=2890321 RepID=UPI001E40DCAC|nr:AraC family transcriptional regulator [Sphingomonas radiodurans]WBH17856.1 AraC family transcriptional regulator [Sphingomonas radiodurans]